MRNIYLMSGAPLPPPPPPPGLLDLTSDEDSGKNARADLLAALNKGTDITKGLKKVQCVCMFLFIWVYVFFLNGATATTNLLLM